jgi:hypothetical protein
MPVLQKYVDHMISSTEKPALTICVAVFLDYLALCHHNNSAGTLPVRVLSDN